MEGERNNGVEENMRASWDNLQIWNVSTRSLGYNPESFILFRQPNDKSTLPWEGGTGSQFNRYLVTP